MFLRVMASALKTLPKYYCARNVIKSFLFLPKFEKEKKKYKLQSKILLLELDY